MQPALWVSKTGLDAQQTNIATISNNLANASTIGFKKGRAVFEDLFYQNINQPGAQSSQNTRLPSGLMLGAGSKVVATQKVHTNGNVQTTSNSLDMMIEGDGFFQILMPDGNIAYSRNGQFTLDDEGAIVTSGAGYRLQPEIIIPETLFPSRLVMMVKCRFVSVVSRITKYWGRSLRLISLTPAV